MNDLRITTALAGLGLLFASADALAADVSSKDLLNMSLAELSNIEVTSVSKKAEKANEAAAAIFVITQDDIKRSGMTSIPDLLRMVPGLDVAQSGSHEWAVSSRGSNDQFANKLLVLIDGRSVYTPLFSGVYWDVQDTPLQDIDRIEVIRGPGATQWGANAVNGVINIITKSAKDTQGGYASQTVGTIDRSLTTVRYGSKLSDDAYFRTYAKYDDIDEVRTPGRLGAHDAWDKAQSGFRADMKTGDSQSLTVSGDIYQGGEDYSLSLPASASAIGTRETVSGGNIITKWDNKLSSTSDLSAQFYYDDAKRSSLLYTSNVQTVDADVQNIWTAIHGHEIVSGASYRLVRSDIIGSDYTSFAPESRDDNLFSAFVQDKMTLHPDDLFLTVGSKFEKNDYTGFEFQPSARLSWLVDDKQTLWTSVSRAVRTPNITTDASNGTLLLQPVNSAPLTFAARTSGKDNESEELVAYEAGYRIQPRDNLSVDISTFYNDYNRLLLGALGTASGPFSSPIFGTYFIQPVLPVNVGSAHSWGAETSVKWNPTGYAELSAGYSLLQIKFDQEDTYGFSFNGKSPQQQFNVQSNIKLPNNVTWSTAAYYVDSLAAQDPTTSQGTPAYTRVDTRLAWQATDSIELSLVGQNLLDGAHKEFNGFLYQNSAEIPRSVYGNITLKF